jgi:hypothetical protein
VLFGQALDVACQTINDCFGVGRVINAVFIFVLNRGGKAVKLSVHFPAVANANDNHKQAVVLNCVDNTVISDADAPVIPIAFQLFNSMRAGFISQGV